MEYAEGSLFFYEGPLWYQRDFSFTPEPGKRVFLHIGAANYRSWFWVNGMKVCEHEGGFTSFDCEVTAALHDGENFIVAAVDNTPGERRSHPPNRLVELRRPYARHLHGQGARCLHRPIRPTSRPRQPLSHRRLGSRRRCKARSVGEHRDSRVETDRRGATRREQPGTISDSRAQPHLCSCGSPPSHWPCLPRRGRNHRPGLGPGTGLQLRSPRALPARSAHDTRCRSPGHPGVVGNSGLLGYPI